MRILQPDRAHLLYYPAGWSTRNLYRLRQAEPDGGRPAGNPNAPRCRWDWRRVTRRDPNYRSTSPTTKKIEPRIEMRSGISVPVRIAGSTDTFENDAVRIFSR